VPQKLDKSKCAEFADKVKIWDLLEGSMSLAEVGNESSTCNTTPNSTHPECAQIFLNGDLVGTCGYQESTIYVT
jgi:hypothetical protein